MGARYSAPMLSNPGPSGASPLPPLRFCARVLSAIRTLAPLLSLAPSCRLRVRLRPRIGSSVPFSSLATHVSLSRRTLLVYPLPSAPVLHTLVSQGRNFSRAGRLRRRQSSVFALVEACALRAHPARCARPGAPATVPPCVPVVGVSRAVACQPPLQRRRHPCCFFFPLKKFQLCWAAVSLRAPRAYMSRTRRAPCAARDARQAGRRRGASLGSAAERVPTGVRRL